MSKDPTKGNAIHAGPKAVAKSLLASAPPHLRDSDTDRSNGGLKGSQQEPQSRQRGEIRTGGHNGLRPAQSRIIAANSFPGRKFDKHESGERLHDELCEIQDAS